jgi:hypothetical protein
MKRLISVFDYSGLWSEPFKKNGWDVIQWDIKLSEFMDINNITCVEDALEEFEYCDGLLLAPPCTDFTISCSQWWPMKDADGRTAAALHLVHQAERLVDLFRPTDPDYDGTFFWGLENPVGRLTKLCPSLGLPTYYQPHDYAGYLDLSADDLDRLAFIRRKDGIGVTKEEREFVVECNAYTKKTGIWGDFNRDLIKRPVEVVRCTKQGSFTQALGGKSDKTKEERSHTPLGFAYAFYEANKDYVGAWKEELMY